ncbi:uncharacterized protein HMPREF1541_02033 [Cyphellophora europaea CBS 101466]|uniref:Uncharacterized protein n=1 Tax=Cyphellophora europaea (strain CBS 101466) TaxID=1220924 RepID=W2S2S7_CYPE1|nr:uncharacterized protein HMPREF1541_02033 [Cyphellophora europaea CBS 101466]ETN42875.1 hypothetical protein HMPREF1541_02033 [Cyphellophora europaea CBS 101466]
MSHEDLKSSAHVWGGDGNEGDNSQQRQSLSDAPTQQEATPSDAPPAYSSSSHGTSTGASTNPNASTGIATTTSTSPSRSHPPTNPLAQLASLASLPFHQYQVPASALNPDRTTLTTTHAPFLTNPDSLTNLILQQSALPPKPSLRISGTHKTSSGETTTDFDLTLSLLPLLDVTEPSSSRLRLHPPPQTSGGGGGGSGGSKLFSKSSSSFSSRERSPLDIWARHFCVTDKSEHRSLRLHRRIEGVSAAAALLEGHVRTLLAALKYRGKLDVAFPVEYEDVVVHKRPGNWLVGLLRIYPEKRFEVGEVVWGFGGSASGGGDDGSVLVGLWWREWEGVVRNAVLARVKGRVGVEDWVCWRMGAREAERRVEWGVDWAGDTF